MILSRWIKWGTCSWIWSWSRWKILHILYDWLDAVKFDAVCKKKQLWYQPCDNCYVPFDRYSVKTVDDKYQFTRRWHQIKIQTWQQSIGFSSLCLASTSAVHFSRTIMCHEKSRYWTENHSHRWENVFKLTDR